jgi:light-regulated signal transduction histidine kinase (bacteriophytochrome)
MSFVKSNPAANDSSRIAALREEHERFFAEVADGLHALAQPLTIVRSAIAMLALAKEGDADCGRYVDLSSRQIERACKLFASVQELLASKTTLAEPEPIDCEKLLRRIVEDRTRSLDERGIQLVTTAPALPCLAFGDRNKTEQALSVAFETAVSVSLQGDVVKVDASAFDGFVEFAFQSSHKQDNDLKSSDRLNLSLAKANILSQQGRYSFTREPFRISLALPAHQPDMENSETIDCKACAG